MSDGAKLAADVYLPDTGGPFPAILVQTPYDKSRFNPSLVEGLKGVNGAASLFESSDYAVVVVDWRGFFGSKDASSPGGGNRRAQDGYECVEWVAQQAWCTGRVGTWGSSALGIIQYQTAALKPPHLTAIMPRVATFSNSYDKYYTGGVPRNEYFDAMNRIGWGVIIQQVERHPFDDFFYTLTDYVRPNEVKVPMLLVGGWFDIHDTAATYGDFVAGGDTSARQNFRLLVGPFTHSAVATDGPQGQLTFPGAGGFAREEQRRFFDRWLLGGDESYPKVTYYQTGSNEWRTSSTWPPSGVSDRRFYLGSGKLQTDAPPAISKEETFKSDPANPVPTVGGNNLNSYTLIAGPADQSAMVEKHPDGLLYSTGVLAEDLPVDGMVEVKLYVASDAVDTDVAVRITDVYPDGRSMLVTDSIQRMSLRLSLKSESLLVPGQIYPVTVKTYNIAHTFLKGHQMRLIVSASNYPRYGLNTNTAEKQGAAKPAVNTLYHDMAYPSMMVLPVAGR
jgi:predicted acyl esterase